MNSEDSGKKKKKAGPYWVLTVEMLIKNCQRIQSLLRATDNVVQE